MHAHKKKEEDKQVEVWIDKKRRQTARNKGKQFSREKSQRLFFHALPNGYYHTHLIDNTLHLISGHQAPPVIPDSWEAEKAKVQFNRFTARQNWAGCGYLTKSFLSQSLYISSFILVSIDESVPSPLPVTPVSTATWYPAERYEDAFLSLAPHC